jgi:hypothetical protein
LLRGVAQDTGAFAIDNVVAGHFQIGITGLPEGFYLKSVKVGDNQVPDLWIDIADTGRPPVEITLSKAGGRLSGTAMDARRQPAKGATVLLIPDEEHRHLPHLYRTAKTDENGGFQVSGIAPGRYRVVAVSSADQDAVERPGFSAHVDKSGATIDVVLNGTKSLELRLLAFE